MYNLKCVLPVKKQAINKTLAEGFFRHIIQFENETQVQTGIFCLCIAKPVLVRKHDTDLMESAALESATAGIKYILLSGQSD